MSKQDFKWTEKVNLASKRLGALVLFASDDFFAEKENLVKDEVSIFDPDKFTDHGKWMDGWESRRKRTSGHDWAVLQLGMSGSISGVDIDTAHFLGNHPPHASLEASSDQENWTEILPKSELKPGSNNFFPIQSDKIWKYLRLNIYPDGGVARLRVYGDVDCDFSQFSSDQLLELSSVCNGGHVLTCSDMFFSHKDNLILPDKAINMGDGWETKRRRGPGFDWAILKLGHAGLIEKFEVDTMHFKGNYPDTCSIEACYVNPQSNVAGKDQFDWVEILPKQKLNADTNHIFQKEIEKKGPFTHVKLNIYPDGGVARFKVWGTLQT